MRAIPPCAHPTRSPFARQAAKRKPATAAKKAAPAKKPARKPAKKPASAEPADVAEEEE